MRTIEGYKITYGMMAEKEEDEDYARTRIPIDLG